MMYCKKCVYPYYAVALEVSEDGICSSCKSFEMSEEISQAFWKDRKKKLDRVKGTIFRKARRIMGINTAIRDMTLEEVELMEASIKVIKDDIKN